MAFRRRARRLWDYWRTEQRTLRQGSVALLLSTAAAFVAGLTLGGITDTLAQLPGLLILIPAAVGMRGTIFGAIGARLGTASHVGTFEVTGERGGVLYQNVVVGFVLTVTSSFYLAGLARVAAAAFGVDTISIWDYVTISVVGGTLGSILIMVLTVGLSVLSHRRSYDLDSVSTPMVTAVSDMITLPTLFVATFLVRSDVVNAVVAVLSIFAVIVAVVATARSDVKAVRRIALEMVGVVLVTPILDILAGGILQAREPSLFAYQGILLLIPPFVSQAGALGGILSSRLSSKLQLGVITPRGRPEIPAMLDGSIVAGFGLFVFALIGVVGIAVSEVVGFGYPGLWTTLGGTMLAGLLALGLTMVVSYYVAVLTFRFGLDPDNQGVPIITSVMDLAGVISILFAMSVLGVAING